MILSFFDIASFLGGVFLLYFSSNLLIDNGSLLAKKYNISKMIIGMSIIALGTSLPEFLVSILASFQGKIDLVIGNVLGSNIANIGLVLGLSGILYKISSDFKSIKLDIGFLVITSILFSSILYFNRFGKFYAIILLLILFIYIYTLYKYNRIIDDSVGDQNLYSENISKLIVSISLGSIGLSIGSFCLIEGSMAIAKYFNISEMIIGVTAIALGTSLPELSASLSAARKKEFELVLGNIFGSNIINIVLVFSSSLLINHKMPTTKIFDFDLIVFLSLTLILILSLITNRIHRFVSLLLFTIYIFYIYIVL